MEIMKNISSLHRTLTCFRLYGAAALGRVLKRGSQRRAPEQKYHSINIK
jgi:hypothetical protein